MATPHEITASDGTRYRVDEQGRMELVNLPETFGRVRGISGDGMWFDEAEDVGNEVIDYYRDSLNDYNPATMTTMTVSSTGDNWRTQFFAPLSLARDFRPLTLSPRLNHFTPPVDVNTYETFTSETLEHFNGEYFQVVNLGMFREPFAPVMSAEERFSRVYGRYLQLTEFDYSRQRRGYHTRIIYHSDGTWQERVSNRTLRRQQQFSAPVRNRPGQRIKYKVCLHEECTTCHGTRKNGRGKPCNHYFNCDCIKCAP